MFRSEKRSWTFYDDRQKGDKGKKAHQMAHPRKGKRMSKGVSVRKKGIVYGLAAH